MITVKGSSYLDRRLITFDSKKDIKSDTARRNGREDMGMQAHLDTLHKHRSPRRIQWTLTSSSIFDAHFKASGTM